MQDYQYWKKIIGEAQINAGVTLPAMFVDLAAFDQNAEHFLTLARESGKKLRPASKSIRVPWLMKRLQQQAGDLLSGWMCFSSEEACFLEDQGLSNTMMAYPIGSVAEYNRLHQRAVNGKKIPVVTIDHAEHLAQLDASLWASSSLSAGRKLNICLDVDMSWRPLPGLHLGVYRSSIRSVHDVMSMVREVQKRPYLKLSGILTYEAQIAALGDANPFHPWQNWAKHLIRHFAIKAARRFRAQIGEALKEAGVILEFFNGGGTGSRFSAVQESVLSEITVGSGLLQSHLFDYYRDPHAKTAFFFALPVTRRPENGVVTVHSGGFIASGEIAAEKAPVVMLPARLRPFPLEGFGEVQTPLQGEDADALSLGDPVLMRPCKAGEIAEHFTHYHVVVGGKVQERITTYRGEGQRFY